MRPPTSTRPRHSPPSPSPSLRLVAAVTLASLLGACASEDAHEPERFQVLDQPIAMDQLDWLCGPYPETLLHGLSQQLVDEVNCIQPGVLEPFQTAQTAGSIWIQPMRNACSGQVVNDVPRYLRPEAKQAAEGVAALHNDWMTIRSGYRDVGMQYYDWIYGQQLGFAAARPGSSEHQAGRAIDVESHTFWRQKLLDYGWLWPFGLSDAPHFEWPSSNVPNLQVESVRAFQRLWNRNHPSDLIAEDGQWGAASESRMAQSPAEGFAVGGCDTDRDGHAATTVGGDDCDDARDDVHPGATELCGDGVDQDCVGGDLPCAGDVVPDTAPNDTGSGSDTSSSSDTTAGSDTWRADTWAGTSDTTDATSDLTRDGVVSDVPGPEARFPAWKTARYPDAAVESACGCRLRRVGGRGPWGFSAALVLAAALWRRRR